VDAWVPLSTLSLGLFDDPGWRTSRGSQWLQSLVRLRPGVPEATAEEDATRAYRSAHLDAQNPFHRKAIVRLGSIVAGEDPLAGGTSGKARTSRVALWLLGVTVILLVIACTNVANLMLARGLTRRGEIAVRMALGVSRLRLARQLLTESLMLAGLGVLLGLALLRFATPLIRAVLLPNTAWDASPVNARVLLVTLGAGVLAALVAGLFPLWRASRSDLAQQLHGTGKSTSAPALLMIGALLFVQSMRRIHGLDLGFAPDRLAMASVDLSWVGASKAEAAAFYREASIRLRATPGILGVGSSIGAPFLSNWSEELRVQGLDSLPRLAGGGPYYVRASAGFLEALDARVVRGRTLTEADERPDAPAVALVTERTASTLWPEQDPIGRCLLVGSAEVCHTVVGVVHDLNRQALDEASRPFLLYFTPLGRAPVEETVPEQLFIRTDGPPERFLEGIRQVLLTVRPDLPFVRIEPFQDLLDRHARSWSLGATLLTVFGGMSLVIAAIGLYGVLAYTVTQRQRELGIRSALGATPRNLLKLVVRGGVVTAGAGLLIGAGLALLVSNRVQELLFRTSARDPVVYFATAAMVLALAFIASAIPAQRATRTNPLEVLRTE
jgi:predicted permease